MKAGFFVKNLCLGVCLLFLAVACNTNGGSWKIVDEKAAPRSEAADDYLARAEQKSIVAKVEYASDIEGDMRGRRVMSDEEVQQQEETPEPRVSRPLINADGFMVYMVIGFFVVALFLFFKFGGTGAAFGKNPAEKNPKKRNRNQNWALADEFGQMDDDQLFSRLSASKDYRAGLIELLRMALLFAAEKTQTVFARSDTEREALARLPKSWNKYSELKTLLYQTELVHYGNRPIDQDAYAKALDLGRDIFGKLQGREK